MEKCKSVFASELLTQVKIIFFWGSGFFFALTLLGHSKIQVQ